MTMYQTIDSFVIPCDNTGLERSVGLKKIMKLLLL